MCFGKSGSTILVCHNNVFNQTQKSVLERLKLPSTLELSTPLLDLYKSTMVQNPADMPYLQREHEMEIAREENPLHEASSMMNEMQEPQFDTSFPPPEMDMPAEMSLLDHKHDESIVQSERMESDDEEYQRPEEFSLLGSGEQDLSSNQIAVMGEDIVDADGHYHKWHPHTIKVLGFLRRSLSVEQVILHQIVYYKSVRRA